MARRKLSSEINVVPYIDVMLVLLIIFMVTAPLMVQGIEVDLPDVNSASMTSNEQDVVFAVNPAGEYFLNVGDNQDTPLSDEAVSEKIGALVRANPEKMILVRGDAKAPYEYVARGMQLLSDAGARKIGFMFDPQEDAGSAR